MAKLTLAPTQDGYGFTPGSEVYEVELDGGAPRQRRDKIGAWGRMPARWVLSATDYASLWTFHDANLGAEFTIDLVVKGAKEERRARFVAGSLKLAGLSGPVRIAEAELWVGPKVTT